jgi:hypothetical protein
MFSAPKLLITVGLVFLLFILPALAAMAVGFSRKE